METLHISDKTYSYRDFSPLLSAPIKILIDSQSKQKIKESYKMLDEILSSGETVYGVNTGFGRLSHIKINKDDQKKLQLNLVRSHSAGVGNNLDIGIVRVAMVLKLISYSRGYSGVHPDAVSQLVRFLNHDLIPIVPERGSVGASGDLAPLSHIASSLIGEGKLLHNKKIMTTKTVLRKMNIRPLSLYQKDGISLVNGTQVSTAIAIKALHNSDIILDTADAIGALSVETSLSSRKTFQSSIHKLKKHRGQIVSARNIWKMTKNSSVVLSHKDCEVVQDPYSFRCIPHVHGACRDTVAQSAKSINNEINSVSDNPLILNNGKIGYSGHFHAEHISLSLDSIAMAMSEIGAISERRIHYFMKGAEGRLPLFLANNPGIESGYMIAHVTASALASENKTLAHPASVDSISTSGGQEDLVSMAPWAGYKLLKIQENVTKILAIEMLVGCAAYTLYHSKLEPGDGTRCIIKRVQSLTQILKGDRELTDEINSLDSIIRSGEIVSILKTNNYLE